MLERRYLRALSDVVLYLSAVGLLLAACFITPLLGALLSPWLGMVLALGSFWVWGKYGPRPMPGCLPGVLCILGLAAIAGSFLGCLMLVVEGRKGLLG